MSYFLWLLAICVGIILTVISHRVCRSKLTELIVEDDVDEDVAWRLVVGNNVLTLVGASLVLVLTLLHMADTEDGRAVRRKQKQELLIERQLGEAIGRELVDHVTGDAPMALVIDHVLSIADRRIHEARLEGLEKVFGERVYVKSVEFLHKSETDSKLHVQARKVVADHEVYDRIVRKHPECSIIVSFAGLPLDYDVSYLRKQAQKKEVVLGAIVDSVYLIGSSIFNGEIKICALPDTTRSRFGGDRKGRGPVGSGDLVAQSYRLITGKNVKELGAANRMLFRYKPEKKPE